MKFKLIDVLNDILLKDYLLKMWGLCLQILFVDQLQISLLYAPSVKEKENKTKQQLHAVTVLIYQWKDNPKPPLKKNGFIDLNGPRLVTLQRTLRKYGFT